LSKSIKTRKIIAQLKCYLNKFLKENIAAKSEESNLIESQNKVKIFLKKFENIKKCFNSLR